MTISKGSAENLYAARLASPSGGKVADLQQAVAAREMGTDRVPALAV